MRDVHGKGFLTAAEGAEVGHIPVQADQPQQALDEASRLPQRHAEKDLHHQAGLDGSVAVGGLSPRLAGRRRRPDHIWIEPALRRLQAIACRPTDRQRPTALESLIVLGPVQGLVAGCVRSAHALQLSRWIHEMNPS
jgi:hypothetical protein